MMQDTIDILQIESDDKETEIQALLETIKTNH